MKSHFLYSQKTNSRPTCTVADFSNRSRGMDLYMPFSVLCGLCVCVCVCVEAFQRAFTPSKDISYF